MTLELLLLLAGGALLYYGAEWLVAGAAGIASTLGVSQLAIGLTVMSYGTSAPELAVSLSAAADGQSAIVLGNVVGSNIANIGLILGLTALIAPPRVDPMLFRREVPYLLIATLVTGPVLLDQAIDRIEGALFVLCAVVFTAVTLRFNREARPQQLAQAKLASVEPASVEPASIEPASIEPAPIEPAPIEPAPIEPAPIEPAPIKPAPIKPASAEPVLTEPVPTKSRGKLIVLLVVGLVGLVGGGRLFVSGAVSLAQALGMSERLIGLTIVAFGTSVPELAASVVAALRGHSDLAVGNVVGSNLFNILFILGLTSMIVPVAGILREVRVDLIVMTALTFMMAFSLRRARTITRTEGALYTASYAAFIAGLVLAS